MDFGDNNKKDKHKVSLQQKNYLLEPISDLPHSQPYNIDREANQQYNSHPQDHFKTKYLSQQSQVINNISQTQLHSIDEKVSRLNQQNQNQEHLDHKSLSNFNIAEQSSSSLNSNNLIEPTSNVYLSNSHNAHSNHPGVTSSVNYHTNNSQSIPTRQTEPYKNINTFNIIPTYIPENMEHHYIQQQHFQTSNYEFQYQNQNTTQNIQFQERQDVFSSINMPLPTNIDLNQYPDMTTLVNSNENIIVPLVENRFVDLKVCTVCGKRITRDMQRHLRTHQSDSRFKCKFPKTYCNHKLGKFNRPYDFKKHLLNRHFKFDDPNIKKLHNLSDKLDHPGTCICGARFISGIWLDEHILSEDITKQCLFIKQDGE